MYWLRIPHEIAILLNAQALDLLAGAITAFVLGTFSVRKFGTGILLKAAAYPLLAVCDLSEVPLHLTFHLDSYVALALVAYEVLSVIENYSKIRPLPKIVQVVAEKAQEYLSTSIPSSVKVESVVKRTEIEATDSFPNPPPPVTVTMTRETHTESTGDK
jgi:phage-related holin